MMLVGEAEVKRIHDRFMLRLNDLSSAIDALKPTLTRVTRRDGSKYIEATGGSSVEIKQTPEERAATMAALAPSTHGMLADLQEASRITLTVETPDAESPMQINVADSVTDTASRVMECRPISSIRVVTWNVWFSSHQMDERTAEMVSTVMQEAPDVLCLQEVVPRVEAALRSCGALSKLYTFSPFSISSYGMLMLVRPSLSPIFSNVALPTHMGRSLLIARCVADGRSLSVATVHLESLASAPIRRKQLSVAAAELPTSEGPRILCGDFNFDSSQNWGDWRFDTSQRLPLENAVLHRTLGGKWLDTWPALYPAEPGLTFDGSTNPHVSDHCERMRYDRVMAAGLQPCEAALLGTSPSVAGIVPSDHYGLRVDLELAGRCRPG